MKVKELKEVVRLSVLKISAHQHTPASKVLIYACYYSNYLTKRVMSASRLLRRACFLITFQQFPV